ncbi:MAG TPA: hypothetical protein PLR88_05060 [Bacteroidales bacterium]|nr:hypothetical protein [Bacteroidales bacterium]HPT21295.1 hypothetical protein [Bacteroidales bacterium]
MIPGNVNDSCRCHSKKYFFALLLLCATVSTVYGQEFLDQDVVEEKKTPLSERLFFGGNFGLQFGTITDILVSPTVGYWVLPRLAVAAGPVYRYYKDSDRDYWDPTIDVETNIFGGKGYVQFVVIKDLNNIIPSNSHTGVFLHAEDELLSLESSFFKYSGSGRFFSNALLAGGGISQPLGQRASLNLMILWAFYDPDYGIYSNPEFRVSFNF